MPETPVRENYITKLQRENAEMQEKLKNLDQTTRREFESYPYIKDYDPKDMSDDRNELVDVSIQNETKKTVTEKMKKYDAVMYLFNFYVSKEPTAKFVPNINVNQVPCYVAISRRMPDGVIENYYKDMPLWLLVDRMINHQLEYIEIKMVRKTEWEEDARKAITTEEKWGRESRINTLVKGVEKITTAIEQAGGI